MPTLAIPFCQTSKTDIMSSKYSDDAKTEQTYFENVECTLLYKRSIPFESCR